MDNYASHINLKEYHLINNYIYIENKICNKIKINQK